MTHPGYIFICWGVALVVIALYSARLVQRGRALSRLVPKHRRRWMSTEDDDS